MISKSVTVGGISRINRSLPTLLTLRIYQVGFQFICFSGRFNVGNLKRNHFTRGMRTCGGGMCYYVTFELHHCFTIGRLLHLSRERSGKLS